MSPSYSSIYRLPYIYSSEPITEPMERIRYTTIDKQLEALFTFLGDGIISGWEITLNTDDSDRKSIIITPGSGVVMNMASATNADSIIESFDYSEEQDTVYYIYIQATSSTPHTAFGQITSSTVLQETSDFLLLGKVTINTNGKIKDIDTSSDSGRVELALLRYLLESISNHIHSGAPGEPDKIDLSNHVKGILSAANIEDLSASKVTSGTFNKSRFSMSHDDLSDIGTLKHTELDGLIEKFQNVNKTLFGDLMTSNLLQLILSLKHVWSDMDDYFKNFISIIPGIGNNQLSSSDSFIDVNNTNAEIDYTNHRIRGRYVPSMESNQHVIKTNRDFTINDIGGSTYDENYVSITGDNPTTVTLVQSSVTTTLHDKELVDDEPTGHSYEQGEIKNNGEVTAITPISESNFSIYSANVSTVNNRRGTSSSDDMVTFTVDEEYKHGGLRDFIVNSGSANTIWTTGIDMTTDNTVYFALTQVSYIRNRTTNLVEDYSNFDTFENDFDEEWAPDISLDLIVEVTIGSNRYFYKYDPPSATYFISNRDNSLFASVTQTATSTLPAKTTISATLTSGNLDYLVGHAIKGGGISTETLMTDAEVTAAVSGSLSEPTFSTAIQNVTGLYLYSKNDSAGSNNYSFNYSFDDDGSYASANIYFPQGQRNTLSKLSTEDNPTDMDTAYVSTSLTNYLESSMIVDIEKITLGVTDAYRSDVDKNKVEDMVANFGTSVNFNSFSWSGSTASAASDPVLYFQIKRTSTANGEDPDTDYNSDIIYSNNAAGLASRSLFTSAEIRSSGADFPSTFQEVKSIVVKAVLLPSTDGLSTPTLNSITMNYTSNTIEGDIVVSTETQWENYRSKNNIAFATESSVDYATMDLSATTSSAAVGKIQNVIYGTNGYVMESSEGIWGTVLKTYTGSSTLPMTVNQEINSLSAGIAGYVTSVKKLGTGNILLLDQDSSRIIEVDENYNLQRIIGSERAYKNEITTAPYLVKALYNGDHGDYGILYLVFSHELEAWNESYGQNLSDYTIQGVDLSKISITYKAVTTTFSGCTPIACDRGVLSLVLDQEASNFINAVTTPFIKVIYKSDSDDTSNPAVLFTADVVPYGNDILAITKLSYDLIYLPIRGIVAFDVDDDDIFYILKKAKPYSYDTSNVDPWYVAFDSKNYWSGWVETSGAYSGTTTSVIPVSTFRNNPDSTWEPDYFLNNIYKYRGTIQKKDDYLLTTISGEENDEEERIGVLVFKKLSTGVYDTPTEVNVGDDVYPMAARFDPDTYDSTEKIYGKIYIALSNLTTSSVSTSKSKVVKYSEATGLQEARWGLKQDGEYAISVNDVFPLEYSSDEVIVST